MTDANFTLNAQLLIKQAVNMTAQVIPGDKGPGLILRGQTIHDEKDPAREAEYWVRKAVAERDSKEKPKVAIIFGLGLGWQVRRLMELYSPIKVLVFEPDKGFIDTFEKYNVLNMGQNPEIFTDTKSFETVLAKEVVYGEDLPLVMVLPGYKKAFEREALWFQGKVESEITRLKVIIKTRKATTSVFMDNLVQNVHLAPKLPDLMLLKGRFAPRPAFVVGAGPSLSENGHLLKEVGDKGIIIAAGAALKPLLQLGVSPHVVIIIESSDTSRFLELTEAEKETLGPDVVLTCALSSHPSHFQVPNFKKSLFHLTGGEAQLLSQGYFLPQGGNAGTAAFALAYVWGLSPIILVGQDQAYFGSMLHAEGTSDSVIETERPDSLKVAAIGGGQVETNTGLLASINWLVEAAALIKSQRGPKLINASAQGASIKGFDEIPLSILMETIPTFEPTWKVHEIMDKLPRPTVKEIRGDLKQFSTLLTQVRHLVHKNVHKSLLEMMNISKVSAFMKELLAPALAGGNQQGILNKLLWADGIILKMLACLEKHQD
ncbi:MAG: DUF115 domain-containing protein [Deltaproteobacteria bacterium]|jgi:hypothetical protein|nr:DUF115 domain-containing protein [Deltaproteobacteria bacterium]